MYRPAIGGSTFSWIWRDDALSAMRRLSRLGLNDFDVLLLPGHMWWDDLDASARSAMREMLVGEGIRIESLNLPALDYNLCSIVPEMRQAAVEAYLEAIGLAADLGARGVVVVPGRVSGLLAPPHADNVGRLTDASTRLLDRAASRGIRLYFESHPQTPLPAIDMLADWVAAFDSPLASIAYDVANAEFIGEDQVAAIRRHGDLIGQYHLSDGTRTNWRHDAIGSGSVEFGAILQAISEHGGDAVAILEIISQSPEADFEAGLSRLKSL